MSSPTDPAPTDPNPAPASPPVAAPPAPALWPYAAVTAACALVAGGSGWLLATIARRRAEASLRAPPTVALDETTTDPAVWGRAFPRQWDSFQRTVDTERTRWGGSEAFQKLDDDPRWRRIFAGYAFSIDYREERGHAYMLSDQRETERVTQRPQPGACLQCHASTVVAYREVGLERGAAGALTDPLGSPQGQEQLRRGFEAVCAMPYAEATAKVSHPVSCLDCHDPATLDLRVTRPAFLDGIAAFAAGDGAAHHLPSVERWRRGDRRAPYDPNALASRQEKRSLVCAQCHVEYHFQGPGKLLVYPWSKGLTAEAEEAVYDEAGFSDWTHAETGGGVLKAQHPEFEMWSQGIHARSGVACADCHMPYEREGAVKVSSHHVRSPLLAPAKACGSCHALDGAELLARATGIQGKTAALLDRATAAVTDAIGAIARARAAGATDAALGPARTLHRQAQWRLDWVAAENSMGFHAPQEAARLLAEAIDLARQAQLALVPGGG